MKNLTCVGKDERSAHRGLRDMTSRKRIYQTRQRETFSVVPRSKTGACPRVAVLRDFLILSSPCYDNG